MNEADEQIKSETDFISLTWINVKDVITDKHLTWNKNQEIFFEAKFYIIYRWYRVEENKGHFLPDDNSLLECLCTINW